MEESENDVYDVFMKRLNCWNAWHCSCPM